MEQRRWKLIQMQREREREREREVKMFKKGKKQENNNHEVKKIIKKVSDFRAQEDIIWRRVVVTLLTAPRGLAHWVDERRSTCSSCRRHRAARVSHSDGVWRQSDGLRWSSSSLVSVKTASAMLALVMSAHSFDNIPCIAPHTAKFVDEIIVT